MPVIALAKSPSPPSEKSIEAELRKIEAMDLSDIEAPGFEFAKANWLGRSRKRCNEVEEKENYKRKVREVSTTCVQVKYL